jgi:molybdate transport repressor ModE-like protein
MKTGGRKGGGASLTPEGEKLLAVYTLYCQKLEESGNELFREVFSEFLRR